MPDPTSPADAGPMTLAERLVGAFRRWLEALRPGPMAVAAGEGEREVGTDSGRGINGRTGPRWKGGTLFREGVGG